ncbi:MAG TPA: hypothetical protein VFU22_29420 [Roseiflexaceae bacterium]|nr:hypothetical protein [Roseiflexaceae bacterium]
MTLVRVTTEDGLIGHGEAKAAVGSAGVCAALVTCVEQELRPLLIGQDARQLARLWEELYIRGRAGAGAAAKLQLRLPGAVLPAQRAAAAPERVR